MQISSLQTMIGTISIFTDKETMAQRNLIIWLNYTASNSWHWGLNPGHLVVRGINLTIRYTAYLWYECWPNLYNRICYLSVGVIFSFFPSLFQNEE